MAAFCACGRSCRGVQRGRGFGSACGIGCRDRYARNARHVHRPAAVLVQGEFRPSAINGRGHGAEGIDQLLVGGAGLDCYITAGAIFHGQSKGKDVIICKAVSYTPGLIKFLGAGLIGGAGNLERSLGRLVGFITGLASCKRFQTINFQITRIGIDGCRHHARSESIGDFIGQLLGGLVAPDCDALFKAACRLHLEDVGRWIGIFVARGNRIIG